MKYFSDHYFGCNLRHDGTFAKQMTNILRLKNLPSLRRSRLTLEYMGGSGNSTIHPTSLFGVLPDDSKMFEINFEDNSTKWQSLDVAIPKIHQGSEISLQSNFDHSDGYISLNNLRIHTQQK